MSNCGLSHQACARKQFQEGRTITGIVLSQGPHHDFCACRHRLLQSHKFLCLHVSLLLSTAMGSCITGLVKACCSCLEDSVKPQRVASLARCDHQQASLLEKVAITSPSALHDDHAPLRPLHCNASVLLTGVVSSTPVLARTGWRQSHST